MNLIERIISDEFMTRAEQQEHYNEWFEYKRKPEYPDNLHIFMSVYTYEDYSGDAWLVGYDTDKESFFMVTGGHCSCYGLEGQWDVEDYTREQLIELFGRMVENYDDPTRYRSNYGDSEGRHETGRRQMLKLLKGEEIEQA
jgi:hypothetical protein